MTIVFWHADKPKYQNEMAQRIGGLISVLPPTLALNCFKASMSCLMQHWNNIDHHRHNKFLYLIRTLLSGMIAYIKTHSESEKVKSIIQYNRYCSIFLN